MRIVQHHSGRRLTWYCLAVLLLLVGPATAQSNPTPATCGLPVGGTVVASAIWTLNADCVQTSRLSLQIPASGEPGYTITINGQGNTIRLGSSSIHFLRAPDSRHTINLNNVTIDGENALHSEVLTVTGTLSAQKVTFKDARSTSFVNAGNATLNDVLFENIVSSGLGIGANGGALNVPPNSTATLTKVVFRNNYVNGVVVHPGATLTTNGCLSFYGSPVYDVIHSDVWATGGTWTDNSTGSCSGDIGNGGNAVLPAPTLLGCGMPASGSIDDNVTWTLRSDCGGIGNFFVGEDARLRIVGNGRRLAGDPQTPAVFWVGANASLEIDNLVLDSVRLRGYEARLTVTRADYINTSPTAVVNYSGQTSFSNVRFEDNSTASFGSILYSRKFYVTDSVTTFRDVGFYDNTGGSYMLGVDREGATLNLEGCIIFDGNTSPEFSALNDATVNDNRGSCANPPRLGPVPIVVAADWPAEPEPARNCFQRLGAIGLICRVMKQSGPSIEVWGVTPESHGFFIFAVIQSQIDAVQPQGLVACSADGRVALRVNRDRSVTIAMGPEPREGKTHHVTMQGRPGGAVIGTVDTFTGPPCDPAALPPPPA